MLAVSAALATGLGACDLSQKKPETISATITAQRIGDAPSSAGAVEAQAAAHGKAAESAGHERSIRLYGPGVSRHRQTRI